ncbi:MAG: hypothetical protein K0S38_232 [Candidatus Paceibacter sp.]|jgi:NAD(P)-dependent dehydrogenase (short-subunit alcohol dehydrogenase family)|nr:hypothetical protein [Candidatus Paceibacter sp.]
MPNIKTAIVTGTSRGIGKALVQALQSDGYEVFATTVNLYPHDPLDHVTFVSLDLTDKHSIQECIDTIRSQTKHIDLLINNAGVLNDENDIELHTDKLRSTLEVNLIGTVEFTEHILPYMKTGGQIINVSSSAGSLQYTQQAKSHFPGHYPAYKISKAALNMYTVTLAERLASHNIRVSSVHPGWVRTEMGGDEATITPEEAAQGILLHIKSDAPTGHFWYKDTEIPW